VHGSFITLGIIVGSWLGGLLITDHGLRAPLWLGAALALTGLTTLIPDLRRRDVRTPAEAGARSN
jgi:predicted MFS family arabinose efflux permease